MHFLSASTNLSLSLHFFGIGAIASGSVELLEVSTVSPVLEVVESLFELVSNPLSLSTAYKFIA